MWTDFLLFPEQASSFALKVDGIYFATVLLCVFFAALVSVLVVVFAIKYRRKSPDEIPRQIAGHIGNGCGSCNILKANERSMSYMCLWEKLCA
jgi:hypothetical protein